MTEEKPEKYEPLEVAEACRKEMGEAHDEHMRINGECPWCGCYDKSKWLPA